MRKYLLFITSLLALQIIPAFAGDLGINVIVSGEVRPGLYGQVLLGDAPRPVVVYQRPRVVYVDKRYIHEEPIYLHVPPGHAKHWSRYCGQYHACEHHVYFVRSEEYSREYRRHEHDRDRHDHHDHY